MKSAARYTVASTVALLVAAAAAQAASAAPPTRLAFDIHAKQMEEALTEFAQATQLQVLFSSELVREHKAPVVSGALTPEGALQQLLAESTLRYEFVNANTVAIRPAFGYFPTSQQDSNLGRHPLQLAEVEGQGVPTSSEGTRLAAADADTESQSRSGIPQVLVRGSRSLNADIERTEDDVRPYVVLDREAIRRSAAVDMNDLLRKQLNMSSVSVPNSRVQPNGDISANTTRIALRGLDASETLILVDGRRVTSFKTGLNETQSDINSIPLAAIERIEVLPATASGIYGGNATGGVVNVVLRRDYSGIETSGTFQNSLEHGGAQRSFDFAGGGAFNNGRTSYLFIGSYSDTDPLLVRDRGFLEGYAAENQQDQINFFPSRYYNAGAPIAGATLNIASSPVRGVAPALVLKQTGQPLNSSITSLPVGYGGLQTDNGAALISNAGRYNTNYADSVQVSGGANSALTAGAKVGSVGFTLRQELTPRVKSFIDVFASRNDAYFPGSSVFSIFTIAAGAQGNPFNQAIRVNVPINLQGFESRTRVDGARAVAGVQAEIFQNWSLGADYSFSTTVSEQTGAPSSLASTASSMISTGKINIFQDPRNYADQLAALLVRPQEIDPVHARLNAVAVRAAGPVFSLPAGSAMLSLLTEGRDQHYGQQNVITYSAAGVPSVASVAEGRSKVGSLYSELTLPVASAQWSVMGLESAELQIAGRYDHYDLEGATAITPTPPPTSKGSFSSVDPSIGLRIEPVRGIAFRGSYGTGYLPPQLFQIQELPPIPVNGASLQIKDPKRGNEFVGAINLLNGGSPDLKPEDSTSRSLGVIVTPSYLPDLRLSFDWTRIHKKNNITVIALSQTAVNQEDLVPGLVIREPAAAGDPFGVGRIVAYDQRNINVLRAMTDSYDMTLSYTLHTPDWGKWGFSASGTRLVHNVRQLSLDTPVVEQAATLSYPGWMARAELRWTGGPLSLGTSARYVGANWLDSTHLLSTTVGVDHLPSSTFVDVIGEYDLGAVSSLGPVSGFKVSAGVKNAFNKPPYRKAALYDNWGDPMMATYFVSLRASLGK